MLATSSGMSLSESIHLALSIGNSRLHWGLVSQNRVVVHWDTDYLEDEAIAPLIPHPTHLTQLLTLAAADISPPAPITPPLLLASVVPTQTRLWQRHVETDTLILEHIPLQNLYPTLGIDRALAVLGAGERYGFPVLVIDGGTALTLTGVDGDRRLVGGAILPGLQVQGRSLASQTAALPGTLFTSDTAIPRWATNTADAIRSGILYTVLAGISDFVRHWRHYYPSSPVIFTGGDGQMLLTKTQNHHPHLSIGAACDATLVLEGMRVVKLSCSLTSPSGPWA